MASAPLAPGLLTTGIGAPRPALAFSASARPIRSVLPPGAAPMVRVTGPAGYLLASAGALVLATLPPQAVNASASAKLVAVPRAARRLKVVLVMKILL